MPRIVEERMGPIAEALRNSVDFIDLLEEKDFQYAAVVEILSSLNDLKKASFLVAGLASVSYMLTTKGEKHWLAFSSYVAKNKKLSLGQILTGFVEEGRSLARFRSSRLKRINKWIRALPEFEARFGEFAEDLNEFRRFVARILNAGTEDKTVVFSVKMFYYTLKAAGLNVSIPLEIPVPVDRRVALISLTSGLVEHSRGLAAINELRNRYPRLVREAWNRVGRLAQVPPLRVDALLWIIGGFLEKSKFKYGLTVRLAEDWLGVKLSAKWRDLIRELSYRVVETPDIHFL